MKTMSVNHIFDKRFTSRKHENILSTETKQNKSIKMNCPNTKLSKKNEYIFL